MIKPSRTNACFNMICETSLQYSLSISLFNLPTRAYMKLYNELDEMDKKREKNCSDLPKFHIFGIEKLFV